MGEVLIKVENVSKKFSKNLKRSLYYGLKDVFGGIFGKNGDKSLRKDEFWAVKGVSFEVKRGQCVGLIGHNGAGKSTLLKMLNGLIKPDEGTITMHGKVGALIELGAGFSPLLTGAENIYNNGAVLGFSKEEIDRKFNDIVEFAELREFIDSPVQNYSSGMKVRLGFAIAAQMEPDILLIDEVLAVGDMGFVLKCFNQMDKLLQKTAMIFVSHSMPMVGRICNEIILMERGSVLFQGKDASKGLDEYYNKFKDKEKNDVVYSDGSIELVESYIKDKTLQGGYYPLNWGETIELVFKIRLKKKLGSIFISLAVYNNEQKGVAETSSFESVYTSSDADSVNTFEIRLNNLILSKGLYHITFTATESKEKNTLIKVHKAINLQIIDSEQFWTSIKLDTELIN